LKRYIIILLLLSLQPVEAQQFLQENKEWQNGTFLQKTVKISQTGKISTDPIETGSTIPLRQGWPVKTGLWPQFPVAADLTGDGTKELIIATQDGYLHIFNPNGGYLSEVWPMHLGNELSSPVIADVDDDGMPEIIVVARSDWEKNWPNGWVHVLKVNGEYVPGWPHMLDGGHNWINSVSISDINNDGHLNIITATGNTFGTGGGIIYNNKIYVFNPDGSLLSGWPVEPGTPYAEELIPRSPLVLVDLDQDGFLEIISGFLYSPDPNGGKNRIFALNHDGSTVYGFPIRNEDWNCALASADMDNDGVYEIYSHSRRYNHYGYKDNSWNMENPGGFELAFADVNNDGYPEIIYGSGKVYVVDKDGNLLPGWPQDTDSYADGNPVAGDIDGDGNIEILIGGYNSNKLFAWHHNGSQVDGFPLTTGGSNRRIAISDLDGDGSIELISACSDSFVYVWDIPSEGPCTRLEWPMYQRDQYHTGTYPSKHGTSVIEEPGKAARSFRLEQNYPNPFNPSTEIRFVLPKAARVNLSVYNNLGQRIRTLETGFLAAGTHSALWNGRDHREHPVPSGVYVCRLTAEGEVVTRKLTLMR